MVTLDKRGAVHLLRMAVRDYGADHELPKGAPAAYFNGNSPLCMVGVALEIIGLRRDMLGIYANGARCDGQTFQKALAQHNYMFTEGAIKVLRAAQVAQDDGAPWGEALEEAMAV